MRYRFGEHELDDCLFALRRAGSPVAVRNKVLDLILYLVANRERVVPKEEIFQALWPDTAVASTSLTSAINSAREALGDDGVRQAVIQTCFGRGYRFVAHVEEVADGAAPRPPATEAPEPGALRDIFVGRAEILDSLDEALREAERGRPGLLLVSGEMGIGKSRVVERLEGLAEGRGWRVAIGRCETESGAPSYWPWIDALRQVCDLESDDALRSALGNAAPEVAELLPELTGRLAGIPEAPRLEPAQARFRLFDGVASFLRRSARSRPLLLAFEDLHRADEGSLLLLRFLARSLHGEPLLVLGTRREGEAASDSASLELLARILREPAVKRLSLSPLSRQEVGEYVALATGREPPTAVRDALFRRTGGNPYFLSQLVRFVLTSNGPDALARSDVDIRLPADLREAVARHLEALPEACLRLLSLAAVFGRDFWLAPLALAADIDGEATLELLEQARETGVLVARPGQIGRYRFAHVLVRDALYEKLPARRRRQLHAAVCQALEKHFGSGWTTAASEIAFHAFHAVPAIAPERALRFVEEAAARAGTRMAHEETGLHYTRALDLLELCSAPDPGRRADLLIELARAQVRAGDRRAAHSTVDRACELARLLDDPVRLGRAALARDPGLLGIAIGVVDDALVQLLRDALDLLEGKDPGLHVRLLARQAAALYWSDESERQEGLFDEASRIAAQSADDSLRLYAESARQWLLWSPERLAERTRNAQELTALASALDETEILLVGRLFLISSLLESGDIAGVDREIEAFRREAQVTRQPLSAWYIDFLRATRLLLEGRFEAAQEVSRRYFEIARRIEDENGVQAFAAHSVFLGWIRGEPELGAQAQAAAERFPRYQGWSYSGALMYLDEGKESVARQTFESLAERGFDDLRKDAGWLFTMAVAADVCARLNDSERAALLYQRLQPYEDRFGVAGFAALCWGSIAGRLGALAATLGCGDEARQHFENALEANARIGALPWLAFVQRDYAALLLHRGTAKERRRGKALAAEAKRTAQKLGMKTLLGRLGELER